MKNKYGIELNNSMVIDRLKNIRISERSIQGTPWYNVLANLDYCNKIAYINPMVKDRTAYIKDMNKDKNVQSDFVVLLLNLSVVPDEVIQQFKNGINGPDF